jgi:hypothetical protein
MALASLVLARFVPVHPSPGTEVIWTALTAAEPAE